MEHLEKRIPAILEFIVMGLGIIGLFGCAGPKSVPVAASQKALPLVVEVVNVERLNDIAANPPFQKTDTLVFRVNFRLLNPNPVPCKVEGLDFEVKVDDGTPDKTIVLTGSMPENLIASKGEMVWSWTEPYIYAGVLGSYVLRGVGGEEGVKGAAQKLEQLWKDLGDDKRPFFVEGTIASSLPDFPGLGITHQRFRSEFTVPKL